MSYLPLLDEVGYGDSYILYDVLRLQRTGEIYRDLSQPPYLAAQYSPLLYIVFASANQLLDLANPFIAPRIVVVCAFALCMATTGSIARAISEQRFTWLWAILIVASTSPAWDWLLQIRADFLGTACGLMSVRLLLSRHRSFLYAAGLCAGLALQFKITFVAAAAAGTLWLAWQRDWNGLWKFCAAAAAASLGLYLAYWMREPRMLPQILTLIPGVRDGAGAATLLLVAAVEAVTLLAIPGIRSVASRTNPNGLLVLLFAVISFLIAAATSLQAGANINTYFEPFFALVPIAVAGIHRLTQPSLALGPFAMLAVILAQADSNLDMFQQSGARIGSLESRNAEFGRTEEVIRRYSIFSTVPRIALIDSTPRLMEPYLLSYLLRIGRIDQTPILEPVRQGTFDGVVTAARSAAWRGIPHINPQMRAAIAHSYSPHCSWQGWLLHLPKAVPLETSAFAREMAAIGCLPGGREPPW